MPSAAIRSAAQALLHDSPYPLVAFDLYEPVILGATPAAYRLLGKAPGSLDGLPILDLVSPADRPSLEVTWALTASGAIDAWRAGCHVESALGTARALNVSASMVTRDGNRFGLALIEPEAAPPQWLIMEDRISMGLVVTDHNWVIEHVSDDVERLLGRSPEAYKGSPVLNLFQAGDVESIATAMRRLNTQRTGATLRTRHRGGDNRLRELRCSLVALCRHSPSRLGLAFTDDAASGVGPSSGSFPRRASLGDDPSDLAGRLRSRMPPGSLSERQWEILTRLAHGERVEDVAAALYLSPSTVRNHLTAIYKKFGVHSQAGVLAKLLESFG